MGKSLLERLPGFRHRRVDRKNFIEPDQLKNASDPMAQSGDDDFALVGPRALIILDQRRQAGGINVLDAREIQKQGRNSLRRSRLQKTAHLGRMLEVNLPAEFQNQHPIGCDFSPVHGEFVAAFKPPGNIKVPFDATAGESWRFV